MHVYVLGSAAGGGFPQWNCNCPNCDGVRRGTIRATARTQSSIAVSPNGEDWLLINASPDVRTQLNALSPLRAEGSQRAAPFRAVLLIDSQIDHTAGLLILREGDSLNVYCTDPVYEDLTTGFPVLNMLEHYCGVRRHRIGLQRQAFTIPQLPGLTFTALPIHSKAPPYSPHREDAHPGDNIALCVDDQATGGRLFYAPGLGKVDAELHEYMARADCLLVDGTFWTETEMIDQGLGHKPAAAMGHLPQSGSGGMVELLQSFKKARKVLIHINNSNPILRDDSLQRARLEEVGVEVAFDGMNIHL